MFRLTSWLAKSRKRLPCFVPEPAALAARDDDRRQAGLRGPRMENVLAVVRERRALSSAGGSHAAIVCGHGLLCGALRLLGSPLAIL